MSTNKLNIIHEDDNFLVINKPVGFVVNDSHTQKNNQTLQSLLKEDGFSEDPEHEEFSMRTGIIHRLDKDTSGVMIIAKTPEFFEKMQALFKAREVKKQYLALCYADKIPEQNEFIIDAPIGRNPRNRFKFSVYPGEGREAVTEFHVLEQLPHFRTDNFLLIRALPKTGRTHQIRVHLSAMNCPVAGDELYAGKKRAVKYADIFKRQMLHAETISFVNPLTNEPQTFTAEMPEDMSSVINFLRERK